MKNEHSIEDLIEKIDFMGYRLQNISLNLQLVWDKLDLMVAEKRILAKDAEYIRGILDTLRRLTSP
tara:strand:+ start:955 stop:1152 length:198 start_codon:yes stop_codon:yes gene_type:complete